MQFDPFVIPFNLGLYFVIIYSVTRGIIWFRELSRADKLRLQRGFFGRAFSQSLKEIFMESLIHRKILKSNPRLGYMHMSLAFGWFLLILFGTIEADIFGDRHLNPPYKAIFFKFFNPTHGNTPFEAVYSFLMDLILAFILSGLVLAVMKRFSARSVGLKKTTSLRAMDKVALTALWLIFPSRLIAESMTSGAYGTGSFLTGSLGAFFDSFLPTETLAYPFWWLYSLSLGTFFFLLPVTRYMHIPTELFLIFMRNSGITTGDRAGSFSEVQLHSCSSCGMCIDTCQLNYVAGINDIQSAYIFKAKRNSEDISLRAHNCLMCGRCEVACPVGIEMSSMRMIERRNYEPGVRYQNSWKGYMRYRENAPHHDKKTGRSFSYLPETESSRTDIVYFAGCMSHLTPSIKDAMRKIFNTTGERVWYMDFDGGACCGRPLMLAGKDREARELIMYNSELIRKSGAHTFVTSCPICFKVFNESYHLDAEVLHHSQYLKRVIDDGTVRMRYSRKSVVFHDPCELGRGSVIYDEPREVLSHVADLRKTPCDSENSLCCGGSLGNITLDDRKRRAIATDVVARLTADKPEIIATACPLCKKTLSAVSDTKVSDIAEIVAAEITEVQKKKSRPAVLKIRELANISLR